MERSIIAAWIVLALAAAACGEPSDPEPTASVGSADPNMPAATATPTAVRFPAPSWQAGSASRPGVQMFADLRDGQLWRSSLRWAAASS